jgi:RloB-like protein
MRGNRYLKRRAPTRLPKRKFVIFSEGKNTEPEYFRAVRRDLLGALVDIEILDAAGVPMTIAEKARARAACSSPRGHRRSSFEKDDQIWAVFDRDEHPNVAEAIQICRSAKIGVAFSDPCFELWLLLHHQNFDRPDDRHQIQVELEKVSPDYDRKGRKSTDCTKLMPEVEAAEVRAEKQLERRREEADPPIRPFTTVFELTREMRAAHQTYLAKITS